LFKDFERLDQLQEICYPQMGKWENFIPRHTNKRNNKKEKNSPTSIITPLTTHQSHHNITKHHFLNIGFDSWLGLVPCQKPLKVKIIKCMVIEP